MDPSLMTPEEIERRGRVIIDPCLVCHHNRQAHVIEGVFLFEVHGQRLEREITDACIACNCLEYVELAEEEHRLADEFLERTEGSALIRDDVAEAMGWVGFEDERCTMKHGYGPICGKPKDDPVHVRPDERMGGGKHIWRHDAKDAHKLPPLVVGDGEPE